MTRLELYFFQFYIVKKVFEIKKKNRWFFKTLRDHRKRKWQVRNQIFEKSREYCSFKNSVPPSPAWHQIFKHIWKLLANFTHIFSKCITRLSTCLNMKEVEGHFWYSVHPIPTHPTTSNPSIPSHFPFHPIRKVTLRARPCKSTALLFALVRTVFAASKRLVSQ